MRLVLLAVGRLSRSPEVELVRTYVDRATAAGRSLGLGPVEVIEVEARKPGKAAEAEAPADPELVFSHAFANPPPSFERDLDELRRVHA